MQRRDESEPGIPLLVTFPPSFVNRLRLRLEPHVMGSASGPGAEQPFLAIVRGQGVRTRQKSGRCRLTVGTRRCLLSGPLRLRHTVGAKLSIRSCAHNSRHGDTIRTVGRRVLIHPGLDRCGNCFASVLGLLLQQDAATNSTLQNPCHQFQRTF